MIGKNNIYNYKHIHLSTSVLKENPTRDYEISHPKLKLNFYYKKLNNSEITRKLEAIRFPPKTCISNLFRSNQISSGRIKYSFLK